MSIKKGNRVKVEYKGTLDDGTVFDSTEKHGEPLEFEVGSGQLIPGFDNAVVGMKKGEKKQIRLEPKDAYGEYKPQLRRAIPKDKLPVNEKLEPGMTLMLTTPDGTQLTASVVEVSNENVTLDLNHPLAGKPLNFMIKIVGVK